MEDKDYSLLRPFDPKTANPGDMLCGTYGNPLREFIAGPDDSGRVCVLLEGNYKLNMPSFLRLAPLCWVEGKPVYKGDVLWHKTRGVHVIADRVNEGGYLCEAQQRGGDRVENLTWTRPKVKREIKLLAFIDDGGWLRWVREDYWNDATYTRVPSEDKVIEVEEPAGQEGGAA